mmetsp:Transcript_8501/g.10751  ORF Transcript_8501/g.10751 Transcript_8501/m.10751 type:complete len:151 (+) Transcript_8501:619-1071(+)
MSPSTHIRGLLVSVTQPTSKPLLEPPSFSGHFLIIIPDAITNIIIAMSKTTRNDGGFTMPPLKSINGAGAMSTKVAATTPVAIATAEEPKVIKERVLTSHESGKACLLWCSCIYQVSNTEKSMDVETPPSSLPKSRISYFGTCFVRQDTP